MQMRIEKSKCHGKCRLRQRMSSSSRIMCIFGYRLPNWCEFWAWRELMIYIYSWRELVIGNNRKPAAKIDRKNTGFDLSMVFGSNG